MDSSLDPTSSRLFRVPNGSFPPSSFRGVYVCVCVCVCVCARAPVCLDVTTSPIVNNLPAWLTRAFRAPACSDVPEPLYPTYSMWSAKLHAVEQKLREETAKCQELAANSNGIAEVTIAFVVKLLVLIAMLAYSTLRLRQSGTRLLLQFRADGAERVSVPVLPELPHPSSSCLAHAC